jgi:hypothetical protein
VSKLATAARRLVLGPPLRSDRPAHPLGSVDDAERLLHNQSALRLKGRLLFMPNVMVTSVPWQLTSPERAKARQAHNAPRDVRGGFVQCVQ